LFAHAVASSPIIACTCALGVDVEVFGVVDVLIRAILNALKDAGFEVEEDGAGDIARIVRLWRMLIIVPDIKTVYLLCGKKRS
jgi:hypothetical protein